MFRLVAKNFSILTAGQVAGTAIAVAWVAFAARALGPTEFGTFILIGAYVRLVSLTMNSGLGPIAFRELARCKNDANEVLALFEDVVSLRLALGVVGYIGLVGALYLLNEDLDLLLLVMISAITLFFDGLNESFAAHYTAHERVAVPAAIALASAAAAAVLGTAVLLAGLGLAAVVVSEVAVSFAFTLAWTIAFRSRILRFSLRARLPAWRRLIALALPFAPIHICNQASRVLNVVLLGRIQGPLPAEQSVGYYGPAQSITNSAVNLVGSLRRVLIPPVTTRLAQGQSMTPELDLASKVVVGLFALPLLLGTSFMAPQLISLLFGEHYGPSAMVLLILGWAGALQIAAIAPEAFLFSHPHHKMQEYIAGAVMSVAVNAVVCILLIEDHGVLGAAAGAVAGRLVYLVYLTYYCRRHLGRNALQLREFGDSVLLLAAAYGVWHLAFTVLANPWLACAAATTLTLGLIAGFLLWLRMRAAPGLSRTLR